MAAASTASFLRHSIWKQNCFSGVITLPECVTLVTNPALTRHGFCELLIFECAWDHVPVGKIIHPIDHLWQDMTFDGPCPSSPEKVKIKIRIRQTVPSKSSAFFSSIIKLSLRSPD
jgi:hypothetical protein